MGNIFQTQVTPAKPKVLSEERIFVYMPTTGVGTKGLSSFNQRDFKSVNGYVSLRWPTEMMVGSLANPLLRPAYTKVLSDEFVNTGNSTSITNPSSGVSYSSDTAEIRLKRTNRVATSRPDLVMLDSTDFEATLTAEQYNKYSIKRKNPLVEPTLIQVDNQDFVRVNNIVKTNWVYAHTPTLGSANTNGFGLVKIAANSLGNLNFDTNNNLQVDITKLKENLGSYDENGDLIIIVTKEDVGLGNVENKAFADYIYTDFGTTMKNYFSGQFGLKLDKTTWNAKFSDWTQVDPNKNTVQKWFQYLEGVDSSILASIGATQIFLGVYPDDTTLTTAYPPTEDLEGSYAIVASTGTIWAVHDDGGWVWYDTLTDLAFMDLIETDANNIKMNGVASVGTTGKWAQSDHIHPSDTNKLNADTVLLVTTNAPSEGDFEANLADETINIPYIRTTQFIHNWKSNPTEFIQDENSNEYYWAGSGSEFDSLDLEDIPNNALLLVEDDEAIEPAFYVNQEQLNISGLMVSDDEITSTERVVIVDSAVNLEGVPVTLINEPAAGILGERRRLAALDFGEVLLSPNEHRMAITIESENGTTLARRSFTPIRTIISDVNGNLTTSSVNPDNVIVTDVSGSSVELVSGQLVRAIGTRTIESWDSGNITNSPIVSNGSGDVDTIILASNRVITTDINGGLQYGDYHYDNVIVTAHSSESTILSTGKILVTGADNTVSELSVGGAVGSILERGTNDGEIRVRTNIANNRLLITGSDGTLTEIAAGTSGQYLVSAGTSAPGWVNGPSIPTNLPQTKLTSNPSAVVANAFAGLVAVVLSVAPDPSELRNNCIYYY